MACAPAAGDGKAARLSFEARLPRPGGEERAASGHTCARSAKSPSPSGLRWSCLSRAHCGVTEGSTSRGQPRRQGQGSVWQAVPQPTGPVAGDCGDDGGPGEPCPGAPRAARRVVPTLSPLDGDGGGGTRGHVCLSASRDFHRRTCLRGFRSRSGPPQGGVWISMPELS